VPEKDPYTPEVLAVYCSVCGAPAGARCRFFSEILGRERFAREPHPPRASRTLRARPTRNAPPAGRAAESLAAWRTREGARKKLELSRLVGFRVL
jgi:hypothetical protein